MNLTEHFQCGVCGNLKPNPQEAQCCHKLFCLDCIKCTEDDKHCPACGANASFCNNVFASRIINIKLKDDIRPSNNSLRSLVTSISNTIRRAFTNTNNSHSDTNTDIPGAFPITVLTLNNKKIDVIVEKSDSINILKLKIEQKDGMRFMGE